jgi:hypothetical protein
MGLSDEQKAQVLEVVNDKYVRSKLFNERTDNMKEQIEVLFKKISSLNTKGWAVIILLIANLVAAVMRG